MYFLHSHTFSCKERVFFVQNSFFSFCFFLLCPCAELYQEQDCETDKKLAICFLYGLAVPAALAIWRELLSKYEQPEGFSTLCWLKAVLLKLPVRPVPGARMLLESNGSAVVSQLGSFSLSKQGVTLAAVLCLGATKAMLDPTMLYTRLHLLQR